MVNIAARADCAEAVGQPPRHDAATICFVPIGVESYGRMSQAALKVMSNLAEETSRRRVVL